VIEVTDTGVRLCNAFLGGGCTMASAVLPVTERRDGRLGMAWIFIWTGLSLHVADEALTGFLNVYNPTVVALREKLGWWPMPTFTFEIWLAGLITVIGVLVPLTPYAFRAVAWLRPVFYFCAVLCLANGCGHSLATIFGQTVSTVHFGRPAPGFYSSPLLLFAGIYALVQLRRTRKGMPC
jgi:hypothetical protein